MPQAQCGAGMGDWQIVVWARPKQAECAASSLRAQHPALSPTVSPAPTGGGAALVRASFTIRRMSSTVCGRGGSCSICLQGVVQQQLASGEMMPRKQSSS